MYKRKLTASSSKQAKSKIRGNGLYYGKGLYYGRGKYKGQKILTKAGNTMVKFMKRNKTAQLAYDMGMSMAAQQAGVSLPQKPYGSSQFIDQPYRPLPQPTTQIEGQGLYSGRGMYTNRSVYTNDLFADTSSQAPKFRTVKDETGAMIVTHQEYIGEIYGNSLQDNGEPKVLEYSKFILNPGMEKTFPWLSQIAQNYQEYEFQQLVFSYRPSLADINSNNGQVGEILMATNYRPTDPAFASKADIKRYPHHSAARCLDAQDHGVECDKSKLPLAKNVMYVRNESLSSVENINDYDLGFTQISVHNTPSSVAGAALGSLYVYYTIKLVKPVIKTSKGLGISKAIFTSGLLSSSIRFKDQQTPFPQLWKGINNNTAIEPLVEKVIAENTTFNVLNGTGTDPGLGRFLNSLFAQLTTADPTAANKLYTIQVGDDPLMGIRLTFPAGYSGFVQYSIRVFTVPQNYKSNMGGTNLDRYDGQNEGYYFGIPQYAGNVTPIPAHTSMFTHYATNAQNQFLPAQSVSQLLISSIVPGQLTTPMLEFKGTVRIDNADKYVDNAITVFPTRLMWSPQFSGFSQLQLDEIRFNGAQIEVAEVNPQLSDYETLKEPLYVKNGSAPTSFFEINPSTILNVNQNAIL